jgi:cyclin T
MDVMQSSDSSHHGVVDNSMYRLPYDRQSGGGQLGNLWYFSKKK